MGGRGASAGFISRIPRAGKAVIHENKIINYLLKPDSKHYAEFVSVGYSRDNPGRLEQDLLEGLKNNEAERFDPNEYGNTTYNVYMMLGVTSKARFRTSWQIDKGTDFPRFITAHRVGGNRK